jgi:adenosylcobinamide kinase/adenosylcobinamide-phosphate guanylyltransferase
LIKYVRETIFLPETGNVMSEFILILGPNGSGKSRFAESIISKAPAPRFYIATMLVKTGENIRRIEKHRLQRRGLGFKTLELPYSVSGAEPAPDGSVLLEDVSNLFANSYFERNGSTESTFADIMKLRNKCGTLAAVSISGLSAEKYEGETAGYIRGLNRLNEMLLEASDRAWEMQNGKAVLLKGVECDVF